MMGRFLQTSNHTTGYYVLRLFRRQWHITVDKCFEDPLIWVDLQINLLAEREMTLVLQMLQQISARLGILPW